MLLGPPAGGSVRRLLDQDHHAAVPPPQASIRRGRRRAPATMRAGARNVGCKRLLHRRDADTPEAGLLPQPGRGIGSPTAPRLRSGRVTPQESLPQGQAQREHSANGRGEMGADRCLGRCRASRHRLTGRGGSGCRGWRVACVTRRREEATAETAGRRCTPVAVALGRPSRVRPRWAGHPRQAARVLGDPRRLGSFPMWVKMRLIGVSVMKATMRISAPQRGQTRDSATNRGASSAAWPTGCGPTRAALADWQTGAKRAGAVVARH